MTAWVAAIAFAPLVGVGFIFANPHGSGNIATHLFGLFLLGPTIAFSEALEGQSRTVTIATLGAAQFIWTWLLVLIARLSYIASVPLWRRFVTYLAVSRTRKVVASVAVAVVVAGALFPVRSVTVPPWRVQFVDSTGKPFAGTPVRQIWVDSGLESAMTSREAEATTDAHGYVGFPERALITVFIAEWSARRLHSKTSRHSYIVQLCDLMDYGPNGAMYSGEELPSRVQLRYFSREAVRSSMKLPANPACAQPEAQAKAADSTTGATLGQGASGCGPENVATVPPNSAIDSDTYSAPLRAPSSARHCER